MTLILVVLLITGGLLIAFLLPRDVHIDVIDLNSTKHWVAYANSSHVDAILEVQVSSLHSHMCISTLVKG